MAGRAERYINQYFIAKFLNKQESYIGAEIEMPLINLDKRPVEIDFAMALVRFLAEKFGFDPTAKTIEGYPYKASNEAGDVFSFETTFNTIEFSLQREKSVMTMANRFYGYLEALQEFVKQNGYLICGRGINPYAEFADAEPLHSSATLAKAEFLRNFTLHGNGEIFHAFCASTQTHLDVSPDRLIPLLNLLGRLGFADALLFANSLPFAPSIRMRCPGLLAFSDQTRCFRDILWQLCGAPNTTAYDRDYQSWEEIRRHLLELKLFVVSDERGGYRAIRPVSVADYYANDTAPERDMEYFRPLEPISLSRYGTVEIRSTCTQPLANIFIPVAFYVGLAFRIEEALELVHEFFSSNGITEVNSVLRRKAILGEQIASAENTAFFLKELVEIAYRGLVCRRCGEEVFLGRLKVKNGNIQCPAAQELSRLQKGLTPEDLISEYSDNCSWRLPG
jgi:glutamate--cysteine ligase